MKYKFFLYFALAATLLVILYFLWPLPFWYLSSRIVLPAVEKTTDAAQAIASPVSILFRIDDLAKENKRLEEENAVLKSGLIKATEQTSICTLYSKEFASANQSEVAAIARVTGRTPRGQSQTLVVDKGGQDGVREGAAVMTSGYLVGRVKRVDSSSSEVLLISSYLSMVPAITGTGRQTGLVRGGLEGLFLIELPINAKIGESEAVLTSGLGGDFPPGLSIGALAQSPGIKKGPFRSLKIISPINFSSIEFISILK
ncbi:MAG: rod shape-determining protein MreC [Candidatus Berkelbacteria bacterium]|nr:rod shape-determining protein MreC [Candidatus Berkelbacteria bacterium]